MGFNELNFIMANDVNHKEHKDLHKDYLCVHCDSFVAIVVTYLFSFRILISLLVILNKNKSSIVIPFNSFVNRQSSIIVN